MWKSGYLDYSETPNVLPRDLKGENFAIGTERSKIIGNFLRKDVENSDDHGSPKCRDFVDKDMWICWSYSFRQKTTNHSAECNPKVFGNWRVQHLKL